MAHLCTDPIKLEPLLAAASHACGASLLFTGVVREQNDGRPVSGMNYSAHAALAEKALAEICSETQQRYAIENCQIVHRLGDLQLGDISVAIVIHSAHRDAAYRASRYAIEALKQRVPIFKQEFYIDGAARYLDGHTLPEASMESAVAGDTPNNDTSE